MRIVAATNRDLAIAVREGKVREDFYYRINVVPSACRRYGERIDDIPLLVGEFLRNNTWRRKVLNRAAGPALNQLMSTAGGQHPRAPQRDGAGGSAQRRHGAESIFPRMRSIPPANLDNTVHRYAITCGPPSVVFGAQLQHYQEA
jgi:hypothetical protein